MPSGLWDVIRMHVSHLISASAGSSLIRKGLYVWKEGVHVSQDSCDKGGVRN